MIRKSILWVAMFFAACTEVWAEAGTIVVRGAEKAVVYNSLRGRGRASFQAEVKGKGLVVNVPEEECRDLLWLIADGRSSWIRLQPGETVSVNVSAEHWKFSGDEKKTNSYLYDWTQKFWLEKPNYRTGTVEMMFSEIPREQKVWPEPSGLYRPEYRKWTESWERRAYDQLTTAKLRDEAFVAEQRERIHYNWLELQCLNFQMAQMQVEIPGETLEFVRNERFEHPGFMDYPGRDNVLRIYFDIADKLHLFDYTSIDFLRRRAGRIAIFSRPVFSFLCIFDIRSVLGRFVEYNGVFLFTVLCYRCEQLLDQTLGLFICRCQQFAVSGIFFCVLLGCLQCGYGVFLVLRIE